MALFQPRDGTCFLGLLKSWADVDRESSRNCPMVGRGSHYPGLTPASLEQLSQPWFALPVALVRLLTCEGPGGLGNGFF